MPNDAERIVALEAELANVREHERIIHERDEQAICGLVLHRDDLQAQLTRVGAELAEAQAKLVELHQMFFLDPWAKTVGRLTAERDKLTAELAETRKAKDDAADLFDKLKNGIREDPDGTYRLIWTADEIAKAKDEATKIAEVFGVTDAYTCLVDRLTAERDEARRERDEEYKIAMGLEAERDALALALQFYAEPNNWSAAERWDEGNAPAGLAKTHATADRGQRAHETLAELAAIRRERNDARSALLATGRIFQKAEAERDALALALQEAIQLAQWATGGWDGSSPDNERVAAKRMDAQVAKLKEALTTPGAARVLRELEALRALYPIANTVHFCALAPNAPEWPAFTKALDAVREARHGD